MSCTFPAGVVDATTAFAQIVPSHSAVHAHENVSPSSVHVPACRHGFGSQSSPSAVEAAAVVVGGSGGGSVVDPGEQKNPIVNIERTSA